MSANPNEQNESVVVPREPTDRMLQAAVRWTTPRGVWNAMLEAAPALSPSPTVTEPGAVVPVELDVDDLAQEIRRVDGKHSLGAGALAEALMPFLNTRVRACLASPGPAEGIDAEGEAWIAETTAREKLARIVEAMIRQTPWSEQKWARMALAIAAGNVRRGRPLTDDEKIENLFEALEEDAQQPDTISDATEADIMVGIDLSSPVPPAPAQGDGDRALREALREIAAKDQVREWMGDDKSDGYGDEGWVTKDGQYAKIARAALATEGTSR